MPSSPPISRKPCAVRFIGSDAPADVPVRPLPPFRLAHDVAARRDRRERLPHGSPSTLRAAACRELATATVACPRRGEIAGEACIECPSLLAWQVEPTMRLRCAVDGEEPIAAWMSPVGEHLSPVMYAATPSTSLRVAIGAMEQLGIDRLAVLDGERLVGCLTRADLERAGVVRALEAG